MKTAGRFWNWVKNEDTGERELYLEGVIAQESWFGDEVTPAVFKDELTAGDAPVTVHINSVGGDCIAASQIYTMLMDYPANVTVEIDGVAASAASVIAMAGSTVRMSPTALMMVHNPWTSASGDAGDMQRAIALLDEVKESIINAYQLKTGMDRYTLADLMDQETWMNARRAKELGFCDEVMFTDEDHDAGKAAFSFSDKACAAHLMNLVRDALPKEEMQAELAPESQPAPQSELQQLPEQLYQPEKLQQADHLSEELPENPVVNVESPIVNDRVKVLGTDTRLEYLRY